METVTRLIIAAVLAAITVLSISALTLAGDDEKAMPPGVDMLTKEQAIEKALAAHRSRIPGEGAPSPAAACPG